ncbi:hypothetical protein KCP75_00005 [Salmonella enterica subsp. enterica]|nr:hypothetical protein KCP75_00005 [Salmonella enterica subsp. enterica]
MVRVLGKLLQQPLVIWPYCVWIRPEFISRWHWLNGRKHAVSWRFIQPAGKPKENVFHHAL